MFDGITDQITCRLVGVWDFFLRRLRILFHVLRQLGILFLPSHHKTSANGIKTSFIEKLFIGICRKVHGICMEGSDLVGSKGNVPFRIEGNRKLSVQHQLQIFFYLLQRSFRLIRARHFRRQAHQPKLTRRIRTVPLSGCRKTSHQMDRNTGYTTKQTFLCKLLHKIQTGAHGTDGMGRRRSEPHSENRQYADHFRSNEKCSKNPVRFKKYLRETAMCA